MNSLPSSTQSSHSGSPPTSSSSKRTYDDLIRSLGKEGQTLRKKKKMDDTKDAADPYILAGKAMPRCIHPFLCISAVLHTGTIAEEDRTTAERPPGTSKLDEKVIQEEKIHLDAFNALVSRAPGFPELIKHFRDADFSADWRRFVTLINESAGTVRANDTTGLKHKTEYILKDPSTDHVVPILTGSSKSDRGFSHPMIARLLCPQKYLENLIDDPSFVEQFKDGRIKVNASDWPAFVYADGSYDPSDLDHGLLRGSVLLRVFRHIFTGPATALKPSSDKSSTCNAALLNITRVTPRMIGYAAIQARFMMSTQEKWSQVDGVFDMAHFYTRIVDLFVDLDDDWAVETLAWWQSQVFGSAELGGDSHAADQGLESDEVIQERQRRTRREAKQAAADAARTLANLSSH